MAAGAVLLEAGQSQGARRLSDRWCILENVLYRGANLVDADDQDLIDVATGDFEWLSTYLAHGGAIGEDADAIQKHALTMFQGLLHARCFVGFDPDNADLRRQCFELRGDARNQFATPTGTKIASMDCGCWRKISIPTVPWPAITNG